MPVDIHAAPHRSEAIWPYPNTPWRPSCL